MESETEQLPQEEMATASDVRREVMSDAILEAMGEEVTPEQRNAALELVDGVMVDFKGFDDQVEEACNRLEENLGVENGAVYGRVLSALTEHYSNKQRELLKQNPNANWVPPHKA